jgi:outer membrane protein TolC
VVNAYLDVVTAERTIVIDQDAVKRAETAVEQTKLFIKAGHKAGNEIITVEANVASAKTQLENDKNNLDQARYALLTAIGLDPNTKIHFTTLNVDALLHKYNLPTKEQTKELILKNDIQYQTDQITLYGPTTRSLMVAQDNTRWKLNVTGNATTGNGAGGGQSAGFNSLFNGANQSQSLSITLQIPIDDQLSQQAVVNAKISLKQAQIALLQEKWSKETSAINGWNSVTSAKHALGYAENAELLQEKTYNVSYQKYLHGLIDSLELQTAQLQLIQAQQVLLAARIYYLKALVNVDFLIGNTLKTWDVKVRL